MNDKDIQGLVKMIFLGIIIFLGARGAYLLVDVTIIRIVSALVTICFVGGILYAISRLKEIQETGETEFSKHFFTLKKEKTQEQERWEKIVELFKSQDENSWRVAILDADSMLEDCIVFLGYSGGTLAEMMKQMQAVPWIQAAWDVHLLRNKLAHEGSRYRLNERETFRAFKIYENIFFQTGYISQE
jgi:hypothetical protein